MLGGESGWGEVSGGAGKETYVMLKKTTFSKKIVGTTSKGMMSEGES